jgi:hypothetical protein
MVMSPTGLGNKDCAGEDQEQFTQLTELQEGAQKDTFSKSKCFEEVVFFSRLFQNQSVTVTSVPMYHVSDRIKGRVYMLGNSGDLHTGLRARIQCVTGSSLNRPS